MYGVIFTRCPIYKDSIVQHLQSGGQHRSTFAKLARNALVIARIFGGGIKDDISRVIYLAKIRKVLVYIENVEN